MRPVTAVVGPLTAATTNNIALSQTPATAGSLTLNGSLASGGVVTITNPQMVTITTTDTTTVFTIIGKTPTGSLLTETLTGGGTSVTSKLNYYKITSITVNQGTTAAVTVGTAGVGSTPWVFCDSWADAPISIQCVVSGTVNYTVQWTNDDPNDPSNPVSPSAMTWLNSNDSAVVNATASAMSNNQFAPAYVRVLLNSGTGTVTMKVIQYNVANR